MLHVLTEIERISRLLSAADGRDPDAPIWTLYTDYVAATLDASSLLAAIQDAESLTNQPAAGAAPDWAYSCTVYSTEPSKGPP